MPCLGASSIFWEWIKRTILNKTVKIFSVDLGPTTSEVGAFKKQMKLIEVQLAADGYGILRDERINGLLT